jgi:hypothetical protein
MSSFICNYCNTKFATNGALLTHKSRNKSAIESGKPSCFQKVQRKRQKREIDNMSKDELLNAVTVASNTQSTNAILEKMSAQLERQNDQLESQNNRIDSLVQQNDELKGMIIDLQNNPRLLIVCNNLCPIEQLDLKQPQFQPVLEILNKELPEYANLGNTKTGKVHAKAIKTLNHIQPTALKNGEDIYYKTENVLSKDNNHKTTKAFIDAIGKMGYEYAQKASCDLKSQRPSDHDFKEEILENASINAVPALEDINFPTS